jgi:uroporphyrinogen decarboxylase
MALSHERPDRCPMQVSFTPEFAERLRTDLQVQGGRVHNPHGGGNTYELERALGQDMLLTSVGWANSYYRAGYQDQEAYVDEWGVVWKTIDYDTPYGKGKYTEAVGHPLEVDAAVESYVPPDPHRPELYRDAAQALRDYQDEYWIVGVTVTTIFECAWALRGYERLMMDMVLAPDLADRILDIPYQYHKTAAQVLTGMGVDMIWLGDDVGGQSSMLMSPALWRRFLKPRLASLIATLKGINPRLKVAYHSDGMILPIIPDLIEIGLDVLNPVQPRVMDPARLRREFGTRLCYWGSIDIQQTLPFGSPSDVENEVISRLKTVGADGGLILGPTHNVQLETPMENFWAMVNTITRTAYA